MRSDRQKRIGMMLTRLGSRAATGVLLLSLATQLPMVAVAQTKPGVELEGAIARERVDGDLKTAMAAYRKIAADTSASRDIRSKALLHLAGCYEKLGQEAKKVYEQIVREFPDQPAASQARARLASSSARQAQALKELKPERLTSNAPELSIQSAAISPDGKSIAYSDPLGIHVRSLASHETRLLQGTQGQMVMRWTPDGNSVETQGQDAAGAATNVVVSLKGGAPTSSPTSDGSVFSPDGAHRATVSEDGLHLSIQDANGANSRELWRSASKRKLDQLQWRPNSKQIAVSTWEWDEDAKTVDTLEIIDIASGRKHVLLPAEKKLELGSMVWASQNRIILTIDEPFEMWKFNSNLWELRLDDAGALVPGGLRKLTSWTDFPIRSGSLSTGGNRLVFIRSIRQRDVYVATLEAGGTRMGTPRRLTLDLSDDSPTGWTPDSKTVIFTSDRTGRQAIFRQDLDKPTAEQIVVMPGHQLLARVTPDGQSLLYRQADSERSKGRLMRVPIGGGTPEAIPNAENFGIYYRCAPAGVCIIAQSQDQGFIVSELDLAKGKGREIYRDSNVDRLYLSPDGKWIATATGTGPETKIVLRSFSTGAVVREIPVPGATELISLNYASDGKGFFWGDRLPAELRELYIDLDGNTSLLWRQPGAGASIWGDPSPDGRYLALMLTTDDSNVYMVENF